MPRGRYIGPFNETFRARLVEKWLEDVRARSIPATEGGTDPIAMLSDEATIAGWQREGLPADRLSVENGSILNNCSRWPLLVDPQLQVRSRALPCPSMPFHGLPWPCPRFPPRSG